jgi:hypothetical protein
MSEKYMINGRLMVGKGADTGYIGAGTEVTSITKDEAQKHGIKAKEFDRLVERGVLTTGDDDAPAAVSQPLSATAYKSFQDAVLELDEQNPEHWTADKKPDLAALKEKGCTVTAAERDEAWALYSAE